MALLLVIIALNGHILANIAIGSQLDFAHSIIGRVVEFQWLMWLNEARTDIPIHLMSPNPGPGHGGMSCASPSKPTFSMAWRHNRNAKNAQSRAQLSIAIDLSSKGLPGQLPKINLWSIARRDEIGAG